MMTLRSSLDLRKSEEMKDQDLKQIEDYANVDIEHQNEMLREMNTKVQWCPGLIIVLAFTVVCVLTLLYIIFQSEVYY